jgi:hypothetical protein
MRFPAAAMLFGFISRMRTGVRFAVDTFLGFTVWVRELKIPRTPERRVSPLCRRVRFRSRPAFAIFAHIPPPSHPAKISKETAEEQPGCDYQRALFLDGWHFCRTLAPRRLCLRHRSARLHAGLAHPGGSTIAG